MKPLVSILIPAYNAAEWIADTLESAVAQTWAHKEIIVVDDGSKDETLAIARRWVSRGVTVVPQQNAGAAAARNMALSLSRGDFIQWLDADDLLAPDKIARQMEVQQHHGPRTLLSAAWGRFMYRPSRAEFIPTPLWADLPPVEWLIRKMAQNLHMQTATWLVSRELTEAAGPWNTRLLGDDDGEYFCRVLLESEAVRFVPESRVYYRMAGPGSLSYIGRSNKKMDAQMHSMRLHIRYLRSLEDSARVRAACLRYLEHWLPFFYFERPDLTADAGRMAAGLGGQLRSPRMSWKYSWMRALFGQTTAVRARVFLPRLKWTLLRSWDKALARARNPRISPARHAC
jgi:glycosyltransferase involved in cell wall biosynthesis